MALETVKILGGTKKEISDSINDNFVYLEDQKLDKTDKADSATSADTANKLTSARTIALTGAVTGTVSTDLSSNVNVATTLAGFDASKIVSGTIDIERLPAASLERLSVVADDDARFALTTATVQNGDTISVASTKRMYFVVDDTKLSTEAGYAEYSAGMASSVEWAGVIGKPSNLSDFTNDVGFIAEGTIPFENNLDNILMDGSASVGTGTTVARGDHSHPRDISKANLASPAFSGSPTAPTPTAGTSTTQIATTEFVTGALTSKASLVSPVFTGAPKAPTPANSTADTTIATTAFVHALIESMGPTGSLVTKKSFELTDAGWSASPVNGVYQLTIETESKEIICVFRDIAGVFNQVDVGVLYGTGTTRILQSLDKFKGFILCI